MKKVLKNVSFVFLLLKMCFIFAQETSARKIIVIDPGHGGKDSGAIGINDIKEEEVVLNIALEIRVMPTKAELKNVSASKTRRPASRGKRSEKTRAIRNIAMSILFVASYVFDAFVKVPRYFHL